MPNAISAVPINTPGQMLLVFLRIKIARPEATQNCSRTLEEQQHTHHANAGAKNNRLGHILTFADISAEL